MSNTRRPTSRTVTDPAAKPGADMPATYEAGVQELEALVARLDSGQLPLDDLLSQYQRGAALLVFCRDKLKSVEQQIQVLDGNETKPWSAT
jgi:exodeoxyribonuclease VII small subunit